METHKELSGAAGEKVVRSAKPLLPTRGDPICLTQLTPPLLISLNVTIFNNADLKISLCQVTITTSLREQHSFSPLACHFDADCTDPEATSAHYMEKQNH